MTAVTTSTTNMTAKLIWITPHAEDLVVYMARVSNPKSQEEGANPEKLIKYLIKHKHWSPFEMVSMCVEIETTRDVSPQILRHRSFSFQEFSQRYASVTQHLDLGSDFELRLQDPTNRQSSLVDSFGQLEPYKAMIKHHFDQALHLYNSLLSSGCAKEVARKVLPIAAPTRLYMSGTLRSWIHYCLVRTEQGTQKEHRQIAMAIWKILSEQCPTIASAVHELRGEAAGG